MENQEKMRLVHFGPAFGVPDPSPFCVKAEAYLRVTGASYTAIRGTPMKSPRGQLPVLLHQGRVIAGSDEIVHYVRAVTQSEVDDWLSDEQRTSAYHLVTSVEEYLYFLLIYQRWVLPGNFSVVAREFFSGVQPLLRPFLARYARHGARKRAIAQGVGRHPASEVDRRAREAVSHLSQHLGEKDFFFGERPCWVDCSMFGFIGGMLIEGMPEGASLWIREFDNLVAFESRFRSQYFPELS